MKEEKWSVWEFLRFAVIAAAIVVPIRLWVGQPFIVSGHSMDPTFYDGDYLIVDELSYHFRKPEKNEVVIFKYPRDTSKYFIKRIVGTPGETIEYGNESTSLGQSEYFVVGDNKPVSSDSRVWGPVEEKYLIGRALLRLWPLQGLSILPGKLQNKT